MHTITLTGLPDDIVLNQLVYILKHLFKNEEIYTFWIKEMADIRGTGLKYTTIEFHARDHAYRAARCLDGFVFKSGDVKYPLSARVNDERANTRKRSPSPYEYRSREREYNRFDERPAYSGYSREHLRSPVGHESSNVNLEIELLRKQRLIIEEERRLLLERKKLELVKMPLP
uniref:RRM domain-containing protein n=1 Tax=Pectinophora gossypiella TaxID=13191 RepID=A0A1E1WQ35_PECGO